MTYSTKIRAFREARQMTHQQFADAVGVTRGAVQQWERGATAPSRKKQPEVAKFLGLSIGELMDDDRSGVSVQPVIQSFDATKCVATLGQTLERLGEFLNRVDEKTRNDVATLLMRYAQNPEEGKRLAKAIEILLDTDPD